MHWDCIVPPDQRGGEEVVVPNHIGGGREAEADGAGEQDGSDPDYLLTITVQVNTWRECDGAEGDNVNDEKEKELLK